MADLYGSNESEDMSSFLQILLNNSSAAAAATDSTASAPAGGLFSSGGAPNAVAESSSRINFSDYSSFFPKESDEINPSNRVKKLVSSFEMLTMRNGLSLHPGYSLGSLQSMLIPPPGVDIHEGNVLLNPNRPENTLSTSQDVLLPLEATNPASSTQPILLPSVGNNNNSGTLPTFSPSVENHYGLLNHLSSAKDICRADTLSRLQLDIGCSGDSSSPGMSS